MTTATVNYTNYRPGVHTIRVAGYQHRGDISPDDLAQDAISDLLDDRHPDGYPLHIIGVTVTSITGPFYEPGETGMDELYEYDLLVDTIRDPEEGMNYPSRYGWLTGYITAGVQVDVLREMIRRMDRVRNV